VAEDIAGIVKDNDISDLQLIEDDGAHLQTGSIWYGRLHTSTLAAYHHAPAPIHGFNYPA
jgi:hypothetical protein